MVDCHRESDWVRYLGIYIDSDLTFSKHISVILGRLNKSYAILRTCKNFMPYKYRISAARALLNSDLYFSIEIFALASAAEIDRLTKQIQAIGRFVLRKYRTEHISNDRIYKTLGIYPVKTMICIQTLLFWAKIVRNENSHPLLRNTALSIFATSRQASFMPKSALIRPLAVLLENFEFFQKEREQIGILIKLRPKDIFTLTKKDLDSVFSHKKSTKKKKRKISTRL